MFRRHVIHKVPSGLPDMAHMHQLLYKWLKGKLPAKKLPHWFSHGLTSVKIWAIVGACQLVAVATPDNAALHVSTIVVTTALYVSLHRRLWAPEKSEPPSLTAAHSR